MRTFTAGTLIVGLVITQTGCFKWPEQQLGAAAVVEQKHPGAVRLTRHDSSRVHLFSPTVVGDSLVGQFANRKRAAIATEDVSSVAIRKFDWAPIALVGGMLVALAVLAGAGYSGSTF